MVNRTTMLALATTLVLFAACEDDDEDTGASVDPDGGTTELVPTWSQVYSNVINLRCAPCHTTSGGVGITAGQLDMVTQSGAYAHLVNVPASGNECLTSGFMRVVPGDAHASLLYLKVSHDDASPCGDKMPLGGPQLSEEEAEMIEEWIDSGAPNN